MVLVEASGESLLEGGALGPHLAEGEVSQDLGITLASDQRCEHPPSRLAEDVGGHAGELDQSILEQLLDSLLVPGAVLDEVDPEPGVVAQLADLGRRDEARPQHATLVELGQPHGVELVCLRPARHLLGVPGVHQPHDKATGLEEIDEGPPVVRRRLHHHPLDALAGQLVGELHDGAGGGPSSDTLVRRRPGVVGWGTRVQTFPDALATSTAATRSTTSSWSSTTISRGSAIIGAPPRLAAAGSGTPGGLGQGTQILIRVLEATVRDPSGRAPGPD